MSNGNLPVPRNTSGYNLHEDTPDHSRKPQLVNVYFESSLLDTSYVSRDRQIVDCASVISKLFRVSFQDATSLVESSLDGAVIRIPDSECFPEVAEMRTYFANRDLGETYGYFGNYSFSFG